jgi:hypothetical protein
MLNHLSMHRIHRLLSLDHTLLAMLLNLLAKLIMNLVRLPRLDIRIKHHINLFKGPPRCLGVHEENMEGHDRAENAEDDVRLPLDVGEGGSNEIGQRKVEDPVAGCGEADAFGTVFEREDFGGVDPGGRGLSASVSVIQSQKVGSDLPRSDHIRQQRYRSRQ